MLVYECMKYIICTILISLVFSCTKSGSSPEAALRKYINYRFSSGQSKNELLNRTTGELNKVLDSFSEEQLNQIVNSNQYKKRKLKINLKNCSPQKCHITYTLAFSKVKTKAKEFDIDVKKIATIILVDGKWKISDISDIKTYVRSIKEIEVTGKDKGS